RAGPPTGVCGGGGGGASAVAGAATGGPFRGEGAAGEALEGALEASREETSSSGFPMTASSSPTGTIAPSFTKIFRRTPEAIASTSIFTLSVSISTSASPSATESPCFFSHLRTLPSVIVSLPLGLRTSAALQVDPHS